MAGTTAGHRESPADEFRHGSTSAFRWTLSGGSDGRRRRTRRRPHSL